MRPENLCRTRSFGGLFWKAGMTGYEYIPVVCSDRTGDCGNRAGTHGGCLLYTSYQLLYSTFGKEATNDWQAHIRGSGIRTGFGNRWFRIGAMKQLLDGSTSGPSSATRAPYSHDPELKGILNLSQREMDDFVRINHEAGYQVTAHACLLYTSRCV